MDGRGLDRGELQFDAPRGAKFFGEWNGLPAEFWRAHVDRVEAGRGLPAVQEPGAGLESGGGLAGPLEQLPHHAAHAVAAGAGLGTVIVIDSDERLSAR